MAIAVTTAQGNILFSDTSGYNIYYQPGGYPGAKPIPGLTEDPPEIMIPYVTMDLSLGISTASTSKIAATPFKGSTPIFSFGTGLGFVLRDGRAGRMPTGVYYQMAGLTTKIKNGSGSTFNNKLQLHYFKVPIQYQFYLDDEKRYFAGGGAYASFLLGKKQNGSVFRVENISKTDAGIAISGGCWLTSSWMVEANIHWGVVDVDNSQGTSVQSNRLFFIKFSYVPSAWKEIKSIFD